MKRNLIIAVQTLIIVSLGVVLIHERHTHVSPVTTAPVVAAAPAVSSTITVRFPDVTLGPNEHITQAELQFDHATIRSIKNIPPSWYVSILLDPPPNPTFRGSIEVGTAALDSSKELPEFEVERYVAEEEPKASKATFMVESYPGDGKERKIEIELMKP
jgi:hypothetical protein